MTLIATALKHLLAAGVSGEGLVRAVEELENEIAAAPKNVDRAAERRREADRAYQATKRAERRQNRQISADSADGADAPPYEDTSTPPVPPVEADASTAPKGRGDRGSKIEESWEPPAIADLPPEARALADRWPAAAYRAEAEAFRNYWLAETGKGARKSSWNRAWANRIVAVNGRVMREAKFSGAAPNGIGKAAARPMNATELRSAIAYAEDQNDFERAEMLKEELRQRQQTGPPKQAAALPSIVRQAAQSLRA